MYFLVDFIRETMNVFCNTAPFLLFGFFLAGILHVLIPKRWLRGALGKRNFRSVTLASLAGIPLPLCSCSVLPAAAELRRSGASKGAIASFVTSTPQTGIDSISLTYALMDPLMAVARPVAALGTALAAGAAVNAATSKEQDGPEQAPDQAAAAPDAGGEPSAPARPELASVPSSLGGKLREIISYAYCELLDDIAAWFFVGIALSGLIAALVPAGAFQNPSWSGLPSMLVMIVIAIPLYVCAVSSTPLAATLILKGLSPGTAMVFLLAGPATNATSIAVLLKVLGRKAVVIYLLAIALFSLLAGLIVDGLYSSSGINPVAVAGTASEVIPRWLQVPAALLLLGLLLRSASRTHLLQTWREKSRWLGRPLGIDFGGRRAVAVYLVVVLSLYLLTGCSVVGPGEIGWVVTFGKVTRTVEASGLVLHCPYPFEKLQTERVSLVRSIDRGFRQGKTVSFTYDRLRTAPGQRELIKEAEVATGDENLLAMRYSIQYSIADPYTYHFALDDPEALVTSFSEYALRRVMCEEETDSILVRHRIELSLRVAERLRQELDRIGAGISILRVDLLDVHAPAEVHFAFRDVASAMEDNHRFIRQAESYRNRIVASARGRGFSTTSRSRGEKLLRLAEAAGKAHGFTALEEACRRTMTITRLRMYLHSASRTLPRARVVLPLTNLPLELWVSHNRDTQGWSEPWQITPSRGSPTSSPAGQSGVLNRSSPATPSLGGAQPRDAETWRDKLRRLEERNR